jgi:hypothetical protein
MNKIFAFNLAAAFFLGGAVGSLALLVPNPVHDVSVSDPRPVWNEVQWPFATDQWGTGRAFQCKAPHCGAELKIYLRAKLGSCNCATGVADDDELDRMGDLDLVGGAVAPLAAGRPIAVGQMKGRSRAYRLAERNPAGRTALSAAFNDRCDMIVATVVLPHDQPAEIEAGVIEFLNSRTVLRWAEVALGM